MNIRMKNSSNSVTIDGRAFTGRSINITGDKVIVDGVEQSGSLVGPIHIEIKGDVESLVTSSGSVDVSGSCGSVSTASGDVACGNVSGSVSTMSGDVTCPAIGGNVSTMSGDIVGRYR